jgi:hypothetical protein
MPSRRGPSFFPQASASRRTSTTTPVELRADPLPGIGYSSSAAMRESLPGRRRPVRYRAEVSDSRRRLPVDRRGHLRPLHRQSGRNEQAAICRQQDPKHAARGQRGVERTSSMPIACTCSANSCPKMRSRSRKRKRGAVSRGKASRNCCAVHSAVGCCVTAKCTYGVRVPGPGRHRGSETGWSEP